MKSIAKKNVKKAASVLRSGQEPKTKREEPRKWRCGRLPLNMKKSQVTEARAEKLILDAFNTEACWPTHMLVDLFITAEISGGEAESIALPVLERLRKEKKLRVRRDLPIIIDDVWKLTRKERT